ncbi:malonyl CoA-acyl carrier protein transacylase [Rhodotorula sp. JG-1b]|nr:malonyl CoA-acyl carrier protein transacylase [Rhodotorula sp. JG-1b]
MLRSAIPRGPLLPASVPGCTCARQASHYPASLSTASHPPPPPPLAPSTAQASTADLSAAYDNPAWSDPAYLRRYRDPARRDVFPSQAAGQLHSKRPLATKTRAARSDARNVEGEAGMPALQPTSASASEQHYVADGANGNGKRPRRNRLEMEALWSGGDFSPPIPLESYKAQTTRPKHALLFPGSGSQYVQMGYFLRQTPAAQEVWAEAEHALHGFEEWRRGLHLHELPGEAGELGRMLDETEAARSRETRLKDIVFEGPQDELTRSSNAQPAILITSIAFLRALEKQHKLPLALTSSLILGHSSGEYSAAVAAGALSLVDAVRLTRLHGLLTHYALSLPSIRLSPDYDAPPTHRGQMSALVLNPGHSHADLAEVIRQVRASRTASDDPENQGCQGTVEVASFNSTTQVVLAGTRDGIMRASEVLCEREIASRAADLPVSAPFHCSFMAPAATGMQAALSSPSISLHTPSSPLMSGLDASLITTPSSLVSNLVAQISLPVRWSTCLASLPTQHQIRRLVFLGPGQALANLARRDAKLLREAEKAARAAAGGQNAVGEDVDDSKETEVISVATEKDMDRLREIWEEEDGV